MQQPAWNFEQDPTDERMDETSYNLRAYFDRMADDKLHQYSRGESLSSLQRSEMVIAANTKKWIPYVLVDTQLNLKLAL